MVLAETGVSAQIIKDGYGFQMNPSKTEQFPSSWRIAEGERLTVQDRANLVILNLAADLANPLADLVDIGFGKKIIGGVFGRPEDDQIHLDEIAQDFAKNSLRRAGRRYRLPFHVMSEHGSFRVGRSPLKKEAIGVLDPIDNSDEHNRGVEGQPGLDAPQHMVYAMYDLENNPLGAVDVNLYTRHLVINRDGRNYQFNPRTNELTELARPARITSMSERSFVLATYEGRPVYEKKFHELIPGIKDARHEKSTKHAKGGSHIYASMATGAVNAYVMFDEPRGEIDQGLPFAISAGFDVSSVDLRTGEPTPYKFDPVLHSRKKNVPLFIAASTPELRDEIIGEFMKAKQKAGV